MRRVPKSFHFRVSNTQNVMDSASWVTYIRVTVPRVAKTALNMSLYYKYDLLSYLPVPPIDISLRENRAKYVFMANLNYLTTEM